MGTQWTPPGNIRVEVRCRPQVPGAAPKRQSQPLLNAIELSVIALSLGDEPASIEQQSSLGWLVEKLTGRRPSNRLANPKLEQLRRYCVARRVSPLVVPDRFIRDLLAAGYSWEAIAEVSETIALEMQSKVSSPT